MLGPMSGGDDSPISETKETSRDSSSGGSTSALSLAAVPFKRRFLIPTIVLALAELFAIGYPLWIAFDLGDIGGQTLLGTALPVGIAASHTMQAPIPTG